MESFDVFMEDYSLDYESSGIYEGPFDNVIVYDHNQRTPIPQHNSFSEEENSPQYSPAEGLHTSEDSFNISPQGAVTSRNVSTPLFSTPQVGSSTSKNNCSTSLSHSRNSHQSTYRNASLSSSRVNSSCSGDENSYNYKNNQNKENFTNFFHTTESANVRSPVYSPALQGNFSQTLSTTMACTSIPTTTVSFSPTESTPVNNSFQDSTSTTCGFLSPSFSPRTDPSNYNFQMATPSMPNSLLDKPPSLLPTPPCSPQETGTHELESIKEESVDSAPEIRFRSQNDVVAFIDNYFKNALLEESSIVSRATEGYREHVNSENFTYTDDDRLLPRTPTAESERFEMPQAIDEWEYFPETPGFSDEDRANSPPQNLAIPPPTFMNDTPKLQRSQNLATSPPPPLLNDSLKLRLSQNRTPPPPPSPFLNDPLQLQRTQTAVDFEHNYCGNGPIRSQAHVLMSPPYAECGPTSSSDHVKRQLKNVIYGKNVQKRKVGRPPKSSYKAQTEMPPIVELDKLKIARPTQGKPEAYTKRMREEHDEKMKMTSSSRSSSKNSAIRRRRTAANDPNDDVERRVNHNTMERTRRDFIKQNFDRVRSLVPEIAEQKKASKATILKESRNYIMELRHSVASKDKELEQLRKRKVELQRILQAALKTSRSSLS